MSYKGHFKPQSVANAVRIVQHMNLLQKEKLFDRVHEVQPHILLTILGLSQDGVTMTMIEHALHVLMVIHIVITNAGATDLPVATRADIRAAAKRHETMLSYLESEPALEMWKLTGTEYSEPVLLAYVVGYMKDNGMTGDTKNQYLISSMLKVTLDLYVDAYHKSLKD